MYLIVNKKSHNLFKFIWGVFDNKESCEEHFSNLSNNHQLSTEFFNIHRFPLFIIERLGDKKEIYYSVITKIEIKNLIKSLTRVNNPIDEVYTYFVLWRIDRNLINDHYPMEPILNGRDIHFHFTNADLDTIEKNGFEQYWKDISN